MQASAKFTFLASLFLTFTFFNYVMASQDGYEVVGNIVVLNPIPSAPQIINDKPVIDEDGDNEEGNDEEDDIPQSPRSIVANSCLSIDNHTLYLYPDGMHDRMTLWVCDVDNHIIAHEVFVMNGERQALSLSPALSGEYYVYIKVGDYYYMGNIWLYN